MDLAIPRASHRFFLWASIQLLARLKSYRKLPSARPIALVHNVMMSKNDASVITKTPLPSTLPLRHSLFKRHSVILEYILNVFKGRRGKRREGKGYGTVQFM